MATLETILLVCGAIGLVLGTLVLVLGVYELFRNSSLVEDILAYKKKKNEKRRQSADAHPRGD